MQLNKHKIYNYNTFNLFKVKINLNSCKYYHTDSRDHKFYEWMAGLVDGDGNFYYTESGKGNYFAITLDSRDKLALEEIKERFGGNIYSIKDANASRYMITNKKGLIDIIQAIYGLIRNPTRLNQMNNFCIRYGIELKKPLPLTFNSGWFSEFIDSDGSIYFNEASGQVFIAISQKNRFLLDPLINIYGGRVDIHNPKIESF